MSHTLAELYERVEEVKHFTITAGEYLESNPSDTGVRELYHNTKLWIEHAFETIVGMEELMADGLEIEQLEVDIMRLCIATQGLILVAEDLSQVFDDDRIPTHTEDLQ